MIHLGMHTDNWRPLSGNLKNAVETAVKYKMTHIEFGVIHGQYFVNGLGGVNEIHSFGSPISGSQVRFNADFGALLVEASPGTLRFRFFTRTGSLVPSAGAAETTISLSTKFGRFASPRPGPSRPSRGGAPRTRRARPSGRSRRSSG